MFRVIRWHLNRRGHAITFWVVNTQADLDLYNKVKVNGVFSDCPRELDNLILKTKRVKNN